jgi:hypothetical protein
VPNRFLDPELVFALDEAWFIFNGLETTRTIDTGDPKISMQFIKFFCMASS